MTGGSSRQQRANHPDTLVVLAEIGQGCRAHQHLEDDGLAGRHIHVDMQRGNRDVMQRLSAIMDCLRMR